MKLLQKTLLPTLLTFLISGCTNEMNTDSYATKVYPSYPSTTGNFIDVGVKGLEYTVDVNGSSLLPSTGTNLTGNGGSFEYFYGDVILFKVGNLHIGRAIALSTVTPKDIVSFENLDLSTSIYDPAVNNRIRLLMSLDADATPANGIQISPETRELAKNWSTPEYNLSPEAFEDELNRVTYNQIDTIATKTEAQEHFAQSLRCVYSGAYRGSWDLPTGEKSGFVGVMIQADGGIVALGDGQDIDGDGEYNDVIYASGSHNMDNGTYDFNATSHFDPELGTIVNSNLTNIDGEGSSSGYDEVEGTFIQDGQKGEYTAHRTGEGINTSYRYTGYGFQNSYVFTKDNPQKDPLLGLFTFDISTNGTVIGMIHDARTNAEPTLAGTIDFKTGEAKLTLESDDGYTIEGTIDFNTSELHLTWYDGDRQKLGYLQGIGCQLQTPTLTAE